MISLTSTRLVMHHFKYLWFSSELFSLLYSALQYGTTQLIYTTTNMILIQTSQNRKVCRRQVSLRFLSVQSSLSYDSYFFNLSIH